MQQHYLAIDPGLSTGWASFDATGKPLAMGILRTPDAFFKFLDQMDDLPTIVIVEEFKLFQKKAIQQSGSDMVASRVIGGIEFWAGKNNIHIVWQPASIKKIAQMWTGKKPPSNHDISHDIDAYNHGMYYLIKNKVVLPK